MTLNTKNLVTSFVVSGFVSIITLGYVGMAYIKTKCPANVHYELFPVFIPLLYGIFGIINYYVMKQIGFQFSFLVGAAFGLLLSLIGRFVLNLPQLIFGFTKHTEYKVHLIAMILYALIFQFIITPLTKYIVE